MKVRFLNILFVFLIISVSSCNYYTHRTYVKTEIKEDEDPEPQYDVSLDENYQNFVEFMFMGNRSEAFGTYFNKFFTAQEDYSAAMTEYTASFIANYNPRIDSLNVLPPVPQGAKDKFTKVIERCSKIIQFNKNTRYIDDAVLLIGKSYYNQQEYLQAERKFGEFLSKLTSSKLYDEAILYLGRTKMKLGKSIEAETILKNLLENTKDNEIKSDIYSELAIYSASKRNYNEAITFFEKSIEETKDKEKKAGKQYIIGKIYILLAPEKAVDMYDKVIKNTSNFDLDFYGQYNKCIALNKTGRSKEAFDYSKKLAKDYRDYPELKQLSEDENANALFLLKQYKEAFSKSFQIIYDYPSSKAAADCYYYIAIYYENVKKDYLNAAINYKKVRNTSTASEYYQTADTKFNMFDKYFTYLAEISDTLKTEIPDENPDFQNYNNEKSKEKGEEIKGKLPGEQPSFPGKEGKGGSGGFKDSTEIKKETSPKESELKKETLPKEIKKDTLPKYPDTSNNIKPLDSLLNKKDSIENKQPVVNLDSIMQIKMKKRFNAYFSMAELFIYSFNIIDSAIYYLKYIVDNDTNRNLKPKAMYMLSSLYKSKGMNEIADELLNKIISDYPLMELANEARKLMGIPVVEIAKDEADAEYIDAMQKAVTGKHSEALSILKDIPVKHPASSLNPKAIYAVAYIYENYLKNKDSAYVYYKMLKEKHPGSIYAANIDGKIESYAPPSEKKDDKTPLDSLKKDIGLDSLKTLGDSLKTFGDSLKTIQDTTIKKDSTIIPTPKPEIPSDSVKTKSENSN